METGKEEGSSKSTIGFAVVGCGHIGKRHAEMIAANSQASLLALCDILPRETLGIDRFAHLPFYSSFTDMLQTVKGIEVVCICTPNGLHAQMAMEALQAGYHVVVEKPMALCETDAYKLLELAKEKQKEVFCVMQNRYSPPSVWIKDLLASGKLGKVYLVQVNCFWNRDARYYQAGGWHGTLDLDGGTLFTQFSHFVDLMYWLFGDISDIQARFADFAHQELTEFEDTGLVSFAFKQGGMGVFSYSTAVWDKNLESSITIIAEKGSVKIGGQYMNEVEHCHVKDYQMPVLPPTNPGNDYGAYKGSAQNHHFVIQNVVDVLNNSSACATTNAYEGYKVVEIIRRIYALKEQ